VVAVLVMSALWLKERTERTAREKADQFMGQFRSTFFCSEVRFSPWFRDDSGKLRGPSWVVFYDSYEFLVDFPPAIHISLLGKVTAAHNIAPGVENMVGLPDDVREREQTLVILNRLEEEQLQAKPDSTLENIRRLRAKILSTKEDAPQNAK
jgi:hypothetical protein